MTSSDSCYLIPDMMVELNGIEPMTSCLRIGIRGNR
jgi:hypothetical protein